MFLCLIVSTSLQTVSLYHKIIRQTLRNTSMIVRAFWKSAVCAKHQLSPVTTEKLQGLCLLLKPNPETVASPTDPTRKKRRRRRCERGQKRGKRGGIRARPRANHTSPAIPSLMLSKICALENKLDLIQLSRSTQHETRDCCVFFFTETWLNDNIPDSAIQLHGLTCCRTDRDSSLSGKTQGGGGCGLCVCVCVCIYIYIYQQRMVLQCCGTVKTLFIAGGVYGCEVSIVLSAAGVHGHCYCPCVHSPMCEHFVNCTTTSVNNEQITLMAFSS